MMTSSPMVFAAGDVTLTVDVNPAKLGRVLPPELFGIAWNWLDGGGGVIEYGELIRDRSFRGQKEVALRHWLESPVKEIKGRVEYVEDGGDEHPVSGKGYPGYYRLSQEAAGFTCISQEIREGVSAGAEYEMHLSGRAEQGTPAVSVFFTDSSFTPVSSFDSPSWIKGPDWTDYTFILKPERSLNKAILRICEAGPGAAGVDEIRLSLRGHPPELRALAEQKIKALGVRSLRWPTGSDADYFNWRESIGPLLQRGEVPSAYSDQQTPSLGLHEFLNFCERAGIVPLITVNILSSPDDAADLVEYVLGPATSPLGALRAKNGHPAPWPVRYFELGNEPVALYRGKYDSKETAKGYVDAAVLVADAMRTRARTLGVTINLQGVLEACFTIANWISFAPMLADWNDTVLGPNSPLRPQLDQVKGNFYSGFNYRSNDDDLFAEVMAGGATVASIAQHLTERFGQIPPFWITEYAVMVQKKKFFGGDEIQVDRTNDFQAGLAAADVLMNAMSAGLGGAYMFNLAARETWGTLENKLDDHSDFDIAPQGLAFSMLSPMSGMRMVPVATEGNETITLKKGDGVTPPGTSYSVVGAVAAVGDSGVELGIINRSATQAYHVKINLDGLDARNAEVYLLHAGNLRAKNIDGANGVAISQKSVPLTAPLELDLPAASLIRVSYQKR